MPELARIVPMHPSLEVHVVLLQNTDRRTLILFCASLPIALGLLNGYYLKSLHDFDPAAFWAADLGQYVFVPLLLAVILVKYVRIQAVELGFRSKPQWRSSSDHAVEILFICLMCWASYSPVKAVVSMYLPAHGNEFGHWSAIPQSFVLKLLVVGYYAASAALIEEVAYRALPWLYLSQFNNMRWKFSIYIVTTSLIFAAAHWEQGLQGVIAAFTFGFTTALLYSQFKNLWPLVIAHFATNCVVLW